jgi:hypothetical protein
MRCAPPVRSIVKNRTAAHPDTNVGDTEKLRAEQEIADTQSIHRRKLLFAPVVGR